LFSDVNLLCASVSTKELESNLVRANALVNARAVVSSVVTLTEDPTIVELDWEFISSTLRCTSNLQTDSTNVINLDNVVHLHLFGDKLHNKAIDLVLVSTEVTSHVASSTPAVAWVWVDVASI
jgi:hypothetical protein